MKNERYQIDPGVGSTRRTDSRMAHQNDERGILDELMRRAVLPAVLCLLLSAAGCQTLAKRQSYSLAQMTAATVGFESNLRFFPEQQDDLVAHLGWDPGAGGRLPEPTGRFDVLALSSGGPDGAYGAGVLNGLTDSGTRPDYEIITGVSTGALIAPFAFVGSRYDELIRKIYTGDLLRKVLGLPSVFAAVGGQSLYPARRIPDFMNRYVDEKLMAEIAAEHARGRRLLVATANLDNNNLTVWNMGRIAALPDSAGLAVFREVLRAAIAIPGALPPVAVETQSGGQSLSELHGDAGILAAFYAEPDFVPAAFVTQRGGERPRIDVVIHNQIDALTAPAKANALKLAGRSVSNLIRTSIKLMLDALIEDTDAAGIALRYTYLPPEWHTATSLEFDAKYMRTAYDLGYNRAISGEVWFSGARR
jgi:predicted acylesterase/phospholipase RssA